MYVANIICRDKGQSDLSLKISSKTGTEEDTGESEIIYRCRVCKNKITTAANIISVNGCHQHTFANPHGKVFEFGCFSSAPGCFVYGPPTKECTWFTGYSWRFSLCLLCKNHLGWKYQSDLSGNFWGLILAELTC